MKTFSQFKHVALIDDVANQIVDAGVELTKQYSMSLKEKNFSTSDNEKYETANKLFSETLAKYCVEAAGYKYTGLEMLRNPQITGDATFVRKFNAVIAQIMTPVAPAVVSEQFMDISEVKQIGFGETARFVVRPNDLFLVNDIAEGVQLGGLQRLYNDEFTVNPTPKQIRYDMPWLN